MESQSPGLPPGSARQSTSRRIPDHSSPIRNLIRLCPCYFPVLFLVPTVRSKCRSKPDPQELETAKTFENESDGGHASSRAPVASLSLLQQLQNLLLSAVRLRKSADTGLAQYLELRQIARRLTKVRRLNCALCSRQVDALRAGNVRSGIQLVDVGANRTTLCRNAGN